MSLEEAILEKVRSLSASEQEEVLRFADRVRNRPVTRSVPYNDRSKEMEWIQRNRSAYEGMWVSLDGDRLIAADPDGRKVYAAAKAEGIEVPFVSHIMPEEPYTSGWIERVE